MSQPRIHSNDSRTRNVPAAKPGTPLKAEFRELINALKELQKLAVDLLGTQPIEPSLTKSVSRVLKAVTEFQPALARERIQIGVDRARKEGKTLGRPRLDIDEQAILRQVRAKQSIKSIAKEWGLAWSTVRAIASRTEMAEMPPMVTRPSPSTPDQPGVTATWLRETMDARGLTKYDFADKGGPDYKTVQKILDGGSVYRGSLRKLASALGIKEADIPRNK